MQRDAGLGWAGLGWAGLGWAGLGWAGLGWAGLGWAGGYITHCLRVEGPTDLHHRQTPQMKHIGVKYTGRLRSSMPSGCIKRVHSVLIAAAAAHSCIQ